MVASINIAKSRRHADIVCRREYDLVIVDEAHHLKNRSTQNWKLVNALKKRFLLLLTATPVENNLTELYNLITLLKPGQLSTPSEFKAEFMTRGDPTAPQNRARLRQLLDQVMIRNTRALARSTCRRATPIRCGSIPRPTNAGSTSGSRIWCAASALTTARGAGRCLPPDPRRTGHHRSRRGGGNLQFCHQMINYDLPWNPMRIEQRIGRIHHIGQESEVLIQNLCAAKSAEDYILEILDRKINMFEIVIGEIDMILGRIRSEAEFSELVYDIWVKSASKADQDRGFGQLAAQLDRSKNAYLRSRSLDTQIFGENYEL